MPKTEKNNVEEIKETTTEQNVIFRITYDSKDGRTFYTHIVHTVRDCLAICRDARKKGFEPKREKIRSTTDFHAIRTVF